MKFNFNPYIIIPVYYMYFQLSLKQRHSNHSQINTLNEAINKLSAARRHFVAT